jgi:hypothetical protein
VPTAAAQRQVARGNWGVDQVKARALHMDLVRAWPGFRCRESGPDCGTAQDDDRHG